MGDPDPTSDMATCWGAQLRGDVSQCTPDFLGGRAHVSPHACLQSLEDTSAHSMFLSARTPLQFKNKFCPQCRNSVFLVDVDRARTFDSSADASLLQNVKSPGFWKELPRQDGFFRIVHNTSYCPGPDLVIFQGCAPSDYGPCGHVPPEWVQDGKLVLRVAKGTLAAGLSSSLSQKRPRSQLTVDEASMPALPEFSDELAPVPVELAEPEQSDYVAGNAWADKPPGAPSLPLQAAPPSAHAPMESECAAPATAPPMLANAKESRHSPTSVVRAMYMEVCMQIQRELAR